ncbi:MAG: SH3 domain-containing protein [Aggregatilineales bacterium]
MTRRLWFICISVMLLAIFMPAHAQFTIPAMLTNDAELLTGPGHTYGRVGILNAGTEVTITQRNRIGNWIRVEGGDIDGWVRVSNLDMTGLRMSSIPVNDDLPDADTSEITDENIARLYSVPILPEISDSMRDVYLRGQDLGNHDDVVVKIGDSNSANAAYLTPISTGNYDLGPYNMLENSVDYFADNMATNDIAARVGLNGFSLFDPFWSPQAECEANETPLACEYRVSQPTIAVILFGPNDLRVLNSTEYDEQMRLIIDETLNAGIIPLLSTFSADPDESTWGQAIRFNNILLDIAIDYDIPLVNLWSAAQALPNAGIGDDHVHMTISGGPLDLSQGYEWRFGVPLQNLVVLHALDAIYDHAINVD